MTDVDSLYLTFFWWTLGFLAVSWIGLAGALVVLRLRGRKQGDDGRRRSTFDVAWTVAPAVIVVLVAVPALVGAVADEGNATQHVRDVTTESVTVVEQAEISVDAGRATSDSESQAAVGCCESGRLRKTTEENDLVN